jgi:hypothetical protein
MTTPELLVVVRINDSRRKPTTVYCRYDSDYLSRNAPNFIRARSRKFSEALVKCLKMIRRSENCRNYMYGYLRLPGVLSYKKRNYDFPSNFTGDGQTECRFLVRRSYVDFATTLCLVPSGSFWLMACMVQVPPLGNWSPKTTFFGNSLAKMWFLLLLFGCCTRAIQNLFGLAFLVPSGSFWLMACTVQVPPLGNWSRKTTFLGIP